MEIAYMFNMSSASESQQSSNPSQYLIPHNRSASLYLNVGIACAFISLFVVPEILGSAAVILGAYVWRLDCNESRNRGVLLIIFALVAMFIGLFYTSFFALFDILP